MTLIVGVVGRGGVILASDSQGTYGEVRQSRPKLFRTTHGVIWGSAGPFAATQDLYTYLEGVDLPLNPGREAMKLAIRDAMLATTESHTSVADSPFQFEGLFAWYDAADNRHYLLSARQNGHVEFERPFAAIGSGAAFGRFAFARSEYLEYETLPLELTKMIAHMVAEDVVKASPKGVDLPIQLATASNGVTHILSRGEVKATEDTVTFFRESQRELLMISEPPIEEDDVGGLRPGRG